MAAATYVMVTGAAFLTTRLGLGEMSLRQWAVYIGVGLLVNLGLLVLFLTGLNLRFPEPSLTREQIVLSALWGMVLLHSLPEARPVVLMVYVPAFNFGMLRLTRRQYLGVAAWVMGMYGALLVLERLQGRPGFDVEYELFLFCLFGILLTWLAFFGGYVSNLRKRLRMKSEALQDANEILRAEVDERRKAQATADELIRELEEAVASVKTLRGLLPICAHCKRVRDDEGYWDQIERYISSHSEAQFSHSICPDCAERYFPEFARRRNDE